ncbi:hypothetical protein LHJ74_21215 [Streptomyces sp. N2-109]|uniref:Transglycosylase SLT domain-containing protein n=1 Tax=Streptomyces gossypii TaxID=2883101 RepID=A0ABT2JWW6_9ACTN|nr:lytic transglycosylase domain-containing protein [Streptomyces gossypii]MCT2592393.1 hypothetical protein [Streptomyces gossypii]
MARYRARHAAAPETQPRRRGGRLRRGVSATALATAAMAAITASQAPGIGPADEAPGAASAGEERGGPALPGNAGGTGSPGDGSYHTELPPLNSPRTGIGSPGAPGGTGSSGGPGGLPALRGAEAGIPATVLAAYRRAEQRLAGSDPGCGLPWELLAAVGKVESGQARGGAVDKEGTTLSPILGPQLNGNGFARITDTDGGAWDGDLTHDRAVGPMQFIPSTWAIWGSDGNGDGRADPNNVYDAALAAGRYLCAGDRDLARAADLRAAILSYNHSSAYVRTVLSWLQFYREGTHSVPDGEGTLPTSPGAGGPDKPGGHKGGGGGEGDGSGRTPGGKKPGGGIDTGSGGGGAGNGSGGKESGGNGGGSGGGSDGPGGISPRPTPGPTGGGDDGSDSPSPSPTESDSASPDPTPTECPSGTASPSPSPTEDSDAPSGNPGNSPVTSTSPSPTPSPTC